jgi:hypothetical protein
MWLVAERVRRHNPRSLPKASSRLTTFTRRTTTMTEVELASGGYRDSAGAELWSIRFGQFGGAEQALIVVSGVAAPQFPDKSHAEAQLRGLVCAHVSYGADITVRSGAAADLQFHVSDRGRYGVRLQVDSIVLYSMRRENRPCAANRDTVSHCPDWTAGHDEPIWTAVQTAPIALTDGSTHRLLVRTSGSTVRIDLDEVAVFDYEAGDELLAVGRLGVYVWGDTSALSQIVFSNIRVVATPTEASNFALLYSTAGYERGGTKRALVRTLNDVPALLLAPGQSTFSLLRETGETVLTGQLTTGAVSPESAAPIAKTFGMQLWEADFSAVSEEGTYRLEVRIATTEGTITRQSAVFPIQSGLVTASMLKPLSLINAAARRAADEDFWRNWIRESGSWSVGVDGAFIADRANAAEGAVLRRVFNRNNAPLNESEFRFMARVTIVAGCDAQLQFRITPTERWGVTLMAGDAGGCTASTGPAQVRIHHEAANVWEVLGMHPLPLNPNGEPFAPGRACEVEIVAQGERVTVLVNGAALPEVVIPVRQGGFALKAWGSTVRFERVQVWPPTTEIRRSPGFSRIPMLRGVDSWLAALSNANETDEKCNPGASQLTGFHDCNNIIGEATSHGTFLAALMDIWVKRAPQFSQPEKESLRRAIVTNVLYIQELYEQGGATGEFAHSEMGRVAIYTNLGGHQTLLALYGLAAFADLGSAVDRALARRACEQAVRGARRLWPDGTIVDPVPQSIIYGRIARAVQREGLEAAATPLGRTYWDLAFEAAEDVVAKFAAPDGIATGAASGGCRDTGRVIPWFEGVYLVAQSDADRFAAYSDRLQSIANLLVSHLAQPHPCDDQPTTTEQCAANGFRVLPQASGQSHDIAAIADENWRHMDRTPKVNRSATLPHVHFHEGNHFAVAASDMVYLGQMLGRRDLEPLAAGNFYWSLGINPGVPAPKVVNPSPIGGPWQAASFVYNGHGAFTRTIDGLRTQASSCKGWVAEWEVSAASPFRETWWIDPQNGWDTLEHRRFQTIVNGHVIWDDAWDYWGSGEHGWLSAETFLRNDGTFIKAALLFEDWVGEQSAQRRNPYGVDRSAFFDTSHLDRAGTGWGFDEPGRTLFAQASRAAHEFAVAKGFGGGRFTGHHLGERIGLLCLPAAGYFDLTDGEVSASGWNFADINSAHWAWIARAATNLANARGFVGGFFTGHHQDGRRGLVCLGADVAEAFDASDQELADSSEGFPDINQVHWAQASRAATNIGRARGYAGGFFSGHRVPGKIGVVGIRQ